MNLDEKDQELIKNRILHEEAEYLRRKYKFTIMTYVNMLVQLILSQSRWLEEEPSVRLGFVGIRKMGR